MAEDSLQGKVIAVTGGASGIGLAIVQKLIKSGAKVAAADVSPCPEELTNVSNLLFSKVDVASRDQVHNWVEEVVAKFGRLDGMCANAGINVENGTLEPDVAWRKTIDVCFTGVWHCGTEAFTQFEKQNSGGVMVTTSSIAGLRPTPGTPIYSAVKSGVIGLTEAWALDWAAKGIRVNSVAPGFTLTAGLKRLLETAPQFDMSPRIPMKRGAQPSEQADAICFLLSDAASYITGQTIACDGGMMCAGS